jgi:hypothetical protein
MTHPDMIAYIGNAYATDAFADWLDGELREHFKGKDVITAKDLKTYLRDLLTSIPRRPAVDPEDIEVTTGPDGRVNYSMPVPKWWYDLMTGDEP